MESRTCSTSLSSRGWDVFTDIRGRDYDLGFANIVIFNENDFQEIPNFFVVV